MSTATKQETETSFDPARLWDDFLKGEVEAYGKIFKYYYSDLYGYGLKLSCKPELVKDCIQDIFVRIGKHGPIYRK